MVVNFWRYASVVLLALVAFVASLNNELLYDDMRVAQALGSVRSTWDVDNWVRQDSPLRQVSVFCDAQIFNKDLLSFHGMNLLWHAAASVVLLVLLRRLFGIKDKENENGLWFFSDLSWWTAVAFAMWPAAASTVGVFAHRSEMAGAILVFLALIAWLRPKRSVSHWIVGGILTVLAVAETRMVLVIPVILFAYDVWLSPTRRDRKLQKATVAAGAVAIALISLQTAWRYWIDGYGNTSMESWELAPAWSDWPVRLLRDLPAGIAISLRWLLVPEFFNADHGLINSSVLMALAGWGIAIALVLLLVRLANRQPVVSFALVWLLGGLVAAALNVLRHDYGALLEQELYIAIPAVALLLGLAITSTIHLKEAGVWQWTRIGLLGGVLVAVAFWSNGRAKEFRSEMIVQMATLERNPSSGLAHLSLGRLLLNGRLPKSAEKQFLLAAKADWNYFETYGNLGETALVRRDYVVSEKCFRRALSQNPKSFLARYHLGHALLGQKKYPQAREIYQKLLEERPRMIALYEDLAATYEGENRIYEARRAIEQAKKLMQEARKQRAAAAAAAEKY